MAQSNTNGVGVNGAATDSAPKRSRTIRIVPGMTFEEVLQVGQGIQAYASGQTVRRLTLLDRMGRSPDSSVTRDLITNSSKYGLTTGSYKAEHLELTPRGRVVTSPDSSPRQRVQAQFDLAIAGIEPFKNLYERFKGGRLPDPVVMEDFLREAGLAEGEINEAVDVFILNAKFVGLLKLLGGAERLLSIEHVLDETPSAGTAAPATLPIRDQAPTGNPASTVDWQRTCFYVTPIGEEESEQRLHSDLFLGALIEPALAEFGFEIVRADRIGKPGMITAQVIEHLANARLVIADLSFHNPNVFYEVALRHARRLPVVQVIRKSDPIPFDLDQFRTVVVDTSSIYTLVPQLNVYRTEITNQVRRALENPEDVENPITVFYPAYFSSDAGGPAPVG